MLQPLNAREHNQAFLKFLFFLILTLIMVVSAVYINFEIPNKELGILRERSDNARNQAIAQENFKRTLSELIVIANRSDSSSKAMLQSEARPKLELLRSSSSIDDSSSSNRMNIEVWKMANQFIDSKSKLSDLKDFEDQIRKYKEQISDLQRQLENCQSRVNFNNGN